MILKSIYYNPFFTQVKAGFVMNVITIGVLTLGINTWGFAYFDLGSFPQWAKEVASNHTGIP